MKIDKFKNLISTLTALGVYAVVLLIKNAVDPLWLGLGLGILLTPPAVVSIFEYLTDDNSRNEAVNLRAGFNETQNY